jgi:heptosyltransferase-2
MERILVVRFSSLGDVILLAALLERLHREHPGAEIWLATKQAYAPLFVGDPRVHQVVALDEGPGALNRMRRRLQRVDFDRVLDAHGSLRSRLLLFGLAGVPTERIAKDTASRLLFLRLGVATAALDRHQVDRYLALDGAEGEDLPGRLHLDGEDHAAAASFLQGWEDVSLLALAPGARHRPKCWPLDRYAALAADFQESGRGQVVILGGPAEREVCRQLALELPRPARVSAGELPLRGAAAVLARCRVLVTNDSGLMHLSESVGTPVLALFGPTSREMGYFPRLAASRVVEHTLPCRPCSRNGARPCRLPEQLCMTRSTVDRVRRVFEEQWSG